MTQNSKKIHHNRCSAQQFLFSQTNSVVRNDGLIFHEASPESPGLDELSKAFPDILVGKSLSDVAMIDLKYISKFAAMAVRIDLFPVPGASETETKESVHGERYPAKLLTDVAKFIDSICNSSPSRGMWGLIGHGVLGCFFPEKDKHACTEFADKMRRHLAIHHKETITIGIASYPLDRFYKDRILGNACKALEHATFSGPGSTAAFDSVSLNISADKLYQKGDVIGAIEEFKTALRLDPSNANAHNSLGVCFGVLGVYKKSLERFESAVRLAPHEAMTLYNAGLVNMLMGDNNKALEYFLKAGQLGEDVFEVAFQTGRLYLKSGKLEDGRKFLEKAAKLRPESGPAFRYLGECYAAMNMTDKAIQTYKKAIRYNPYDSASLSALGYLFDIQGESPEISMVFCQHSVEISPENGLFRHRLGSLYLKQNRLDEALKEFIKAVKLGHEDAMPFIEDIQNRLTGHQ